MKGFGIAYLLLAAAVVALIIWRRMWKRSPGDFAYWCSIAVLLVHTGVAYFFM